MFPSKGETSRPLPVHLTLSKSLIRLPVNKRLTYKRRKLLNTRRFVMF